VFLYNKLKVHSKKCWVVSTQIWVKHCMYKPKYWVKNAIKILQLKVKVEVGLKFEITFLTQHLG